MYARTIAYLLTVLIPLLTASRSLAASDETDTPTSSSINLISNTYVFLGTADQCRDHLATRINQTSRSICLTIAEQHYVHLADSIRQAHARGCSVSIFTDHTPPANLLPDQATDNKDATNSATEQYDTNTDPAAADTPVSGTLQVHTPTRDTSFGMSLSDGLPFVTAIADDTILQCSPALPSACSQCIFQITAVANPALAASYSKQWQLLANGNPTTTSMIAASDTPPVDQLDPAAEYRRKLAAPIDFSTKTYIPYHGAKGVSIHYAVAEMCRRADVPYQSRRSNALGGSILRRYVDYTVVQIPADQAIAQLLDEHDITYTIDQQGLYCHAPGTTDDHSSTASRTTADRSSNDSRTIIVYVTNTGTKYHLPTCRHLSKSRKNMTLRDAKEQGYEPCRVCKPPE